MIHKIKYELFLCLISRDLNKKQVLCKQFEFPMFYCIKNAFFIYIYSSKEQIVKHLQHLHLFSNVKINYFQ